MISSSSLQQFKAIWLDEFQEELTDEVALEKATQLLTVFDAVYRPVKREWLTENEYERQPSTI